MVDRDRVVKLIPYTFKKKCPGLNKSNYMVPNHTVDKLG